MLLPFEFPFEEASGELRWEEGRGPKPLQTGGKAGPSVPTVGSYLPTGKDTPTPMAPYTMLCLPPHHIQAERALPQQFRCSRQ